MAPRLLICLLLACIALPVAAREVARMDANGAGAGCPATEETETDADAARTGGKRATPAPTRAKATTVRRGGGDAEAGGRPPRWHSFLPGMIR